MQLVHPYPGVGGSKVTIIDFHTGVVVPESGVRDWYLDDGYESIMFAQPAFVELCHLIKRNVQAAPETTAKISRDH